jgi:hypothetical protein
MHQAGLNARVATIGTTAAGNVYYFNYEFNTIMIDGRGLDLSASRLMFDKNWVCVHPSDPSIEMSNTFD